MTHMRFSTRYCVPRLTDADQPQHTRDCKRELLCAVDGFVLDLCRFDWASDASLVPTSARCLLEKASFLVPAKANGRDVACVVQASWEHSTLGPTAACKALRRDLIQRFEALLVAYSSLIKIPPAQADRCCNVKTSNTPVRLGGGARRRTIRCTCSIPGFRWMSVPLVKNSLKNQKINSQ